MGIQVYRNFFEDMSQVLDDVKKHGFWPTTLVSKASPALDTHWHDSDVHGYVVQGSAWVLDGESGDMWDSGMVMSDRSANVSYSGKPLESFARSSPAAHAYRRLWEEMHLIFLGFFRMMILECARGVIG